jgi:hypothetical protein
MKELVPEDPVVDVFAVVPFGPFGPAPAEKIDPKLETPPATPSSPLLVSTD